MKNVYQMLVVALSFFAVAGGTAGQEGVGLPHAINYKTEMTCTPFHSASGQILVGSMSPQLVSSQGSLFLKTGAVSPFAKPVFIALAFTKSLPMNGGSSVEIYQASSITVHVVVQGTAAQSATIQYGAATAVCQPVAE